MGYTSSNTQDCSGRQNKGRTFFTGFWPNPGPGRRPLDSDRRDAEFACVFPSVAFLTVSFVPQSIFWNPAEKKVKKYVQARPGNMFQLYVATHNAKHMEVVFGRPHYFGGGGGALLGMVKLKYTTNTCVNMSST